MSNRYEIREQIGKGGLGAVYKGFDTQLQREVAIKRVLQAGQATEEEVKEAASKLIAEAQTLSSLNHPNIITVFDVGQDEQGGFVVMELLKGETLDDTIERGVLTQEDFIEVVYQTMEALIAAQANDVIHRDIKPTNIMVIWQASGKFALKILDFGLAKFSKSPSVQTMDQNESVMGSIFFMAPEQFERGELDARTDLYQMGCVYYNALTGQYPFNGETAPQVMNAHLQHKVVPLDQIRPDMSPSICQWVMWLINRDIDHRPVDAREALKMWPKNPEAPASEILQALPVEEAPRVTSSQVTIVTSASQAAAPPALIVKSPSGQTGAVTGRLQTGAVTGRLQTGGTPTLGATGAVASRAAGPARPESSAQSSGKSPLKWILTGSAALTLVVGIGLVLMKKGAEKKREDRILALSSEEEPTGTATDISWAADIIGSDSATRPLKLDALKVLKRLSGPSVEDQLMLEMREAETTFMKRQLALALGERGHSPAAPLVLAAFQSATSEQDQINFLAALQSVAGKEMIGPMLDALKQKKGRDVRSGLENILLAIMRKDSETINATVDTMLGRLSAADGDERRSLFRILGSLGHPKVRNRLNSIFKRDDNGEMKQAAMTAYLSWPNQDLLGDVEKLVSSGDRAISAAASRAAIELATRPAPQTAAQRKAVWQRAFAQITNPNDVGKLMTDLLDRPHPVNLELLNEWSKHEKYGPFAQRYESTMKKAIQGIKDYPADGLPGNGARVAGARAAGVDS
ncbi:MAG: serine/threonine-protein kinase, partial [Verrucomicrobiota bacterium]